jgi:hypothetical protein
MTNYIDLTCGYRDFTLVFDSQRSTALVSGFNELLRTLANGSNRTLADGSNRTLLDPGASGYTAAPIDFTAGYRDFTVLV